MAVARLPLRYLGFLVICCSGWWGYFQTTYNHAPGICRKLHGTGMIIFISFYGLNMGLLT